MCRGNRRIWRSGVTCTQAGASHLNALAPSRDHVTLVYHGLDLDRFPALRKAITERMEDSEQ